MTNLGVTVHESENLQHLGSNMNTLNVALTAGNAAWNQFKKYRDEKAIETYNRLSDAAESVGGIDGLRERGTGLLDDSRREAGNVTRAARARLQKALDEAAERGQELSEDVAASGKQGKKNLSRASRQAAKKAAKTRQKSADRVSKAAAKKADKKASGGNKWLVVGIVAGLAAAIGGGAYWWMNRKDTPGTTPPRVEEQGGETEAESTLVYSTATPAEVEPAQSKVQSEEELLASLDEQLSDLRAEDGEAESEDAAAAEGAEADTAEDTVASDELLAEGEEIQAEYDKNNAPKDDKK